MNRPYQSSNYLKICALFLSRDWPLPVLGAECPHESDEGDGLVGDVVALRLEALDLHNHTSGRIHTHYQLD